MINVNQQALLELLKASLFGIEPLFPEGVDWDAVLQEAKDQTVVALAAPAVPEEEVEKWRIPAAQNKMRFFQILDEQAKLVKLFQDVGIPLVILKGCAAAMYYPEPLQRTMGDIDFIVPPERFEEADSFMVNNGYVFCDDCPRHKKYSKNGIVFELHKRYSDTRWDLEPLILNGISEAASYELYGQRFPALLNEINGLILLDHIRMHFYIGLGLRQIIDWMMFVHSSLSVDSAWEEHFLLLVREVRLETFAMTVTKMCKLWLGLPDRITWCDSADSETAGQLLKIIFSYGNFGIKEHNSQRSLEGLIMETSRSGVFHFLQKTGETTWKAYHKHPVLRPFAWLYQAIRFLKNGVVALFRGERNKVESYHAIKMYKFHKKLGINYKQKRKKKVE
ncbi:MAG: nucleotidyltransferase family protein [Ruminococcus sp.]|nr:nucleotidyltransferase family protein [Ruminococcus sp.]